MRQLRNILLLADHALERPSPAMRRAVQLALTTGAQLHMYLFEHCPAIDAIGHLNRQVAHLARNAFARERVAWLNDAAFSLKLQTPPIRTAFVWGALTHRRILGCIRKLEPDLVIKDAQLEPSIQRIAPGPLDWKLLRLCPAPLMLVNRFASPMPRRVIAAVEPVAPEHRQGRLNDLIVQEAQALALQCKATVHLAHVFEGIPPSVLGEPSRSIATLGRLYDELRNRAEAQFREFAAEHSIPADCQHLLNGPPAETLAHFAADAKVDVLVLGTIRRGTMRRPAIGSTAERILHRAGCDVLVIKPEGFSESYGSYRTGPGEMKAVA